MTKFRFHPAGHKKKSAATTNRICRPITSWCEKGFFVASDLKSQTNLSDKSIERYIKLLLEKGFFYVKKGKDKRNYKVNFNNEYNSTYTRYDEGSHRSAKCS